MKGETEREGGGGRREGNDSTWGILREVEEEEEEEEWSERYNHWLADKKRVVVVQLST